MFNNALLDIAIGLVLMYLVLSLMGTVINEFISTGISLRSRTLKSAIQNLLDDPKLHAAFYNHGLIDGTKQAAGDPSYLTGQTFAMAVIGSLDPANPVPGIDAIKKAVGDLSVNSNIRDALLAEVARAGDDVTRLRDGIAHYFDASMDRVSGVYKRYLKWISLGVGFLIVLALNADSIKVGVSLWNDSSLRAQMLATSQSVVSAKMPNTTINTLDTAKLRDTLNDLENDVRPLPVGWTASDLVTPLSLTGVWYWLKKFFGLAITALAISLGAPFWFDLLSKFMNVRGTGAKPQSTTSP
jgi:hypothetical protein